MFFSITPYSFHTELSQNPSYILTTLTFYRRNPANKKLFYFYSINVGPKDNSINRKKGTSVHWVNLIDISESQLFKKTFSPSEDNQNYFFLFECQYTAEKCTSLMFTCLLICMPNSFYQYYQVSFAKTHQPPGCSR